MLRTADGYVRVSRVAGRSGESFISPKEQRATIEDWARRNKVEIVEWHEELDQSGGTLERPKFQKALQRCRAGVTGGIVAARLDRLTRSVVGLGTLLADAGEHGFNVVAIDLGLDLHSPNGELVANLFGSVAQWERRRRAEDWETARRNAIGRGIVNGRVPYGYAKAEGDRRLVVVKGEAKLIRDAFERRAAGESVLSIAGRFGWSHSTTSQRLADEVYLGVARAGGHRNEDAHPAIVSRELFESVRITPAATRPTGETTADRLLLSIARCGGCGRTLKVVRRKRKDGTHVPAYYCKNSASEPCHDRAFVRADDLDRHVADWFETALASEPRFVQAVESAEELDQARDELAAAEAELRSFVVNASALDAALFTQGIESRQGRVDTARQWMAAVAAQAKALPIGGTVAQVWHGLEPLDRRQVLAGYLDRVVVRRGAGVDLAGNVAIVWAGVAAEATVEDGEERALVAAA